MSINQKIDANQRQLIDKIETHFMMMIEKQGTVSNQLSDHTKRIAVLESRN